MSKTHEQDGKKQQNSKWKNDPFWGSWGWKSRLRVKKSRKSRWNNHEKDGRRDWKSDQDEKKYDLQFFFFFVSCKDRTIKNGSKSWRHRKR